jgi:hypothetical protein
MVEASCVNLGMNLSLACVVTAKVGSPRVRVRIGLF